MEICEQCKQKIQNFYNFKMNVLDARNSFNPPHETLLRDDCVQDGKEFTTLDIIRSFIKNNSIKSIEITRESNHILVLSGIPTEDVKTLTQQSEAKQSQSIGDESDLEYFEEFLEDSSNENDSSNGNFTQPIAVGESTGDVDKVVGALKRKRNPEEWACNKRKKLRNTGKSYVNSKGRVVNERKMLENCALSRCRSNCHTKISDQDRQKNFKIFWSLGDVVEQRKFIYSHVISKDIKRKKSTNSSRTVTLQFYLDSWDKQDVITSIQVCKKMFKNTLAVSNQLIQGAISKHSASGFVDVRGKHVRKITQAQKLAQEHVAKFPYFYVERTMTKRQLYSMYIEECKKANIDPVKESNYRDIFEKYNTNSFLKTTKDVCSFCSYYQEKSAPKDRANSEYLQHLKESKKCRDRVNGRIRYRSSAGKIDRAAN